MSDLPLARVGVRDDVREPDAWYWELPAIAQLRAEGMALAPVTVLSARTAAASPRWSSRSRTPGRSPSPRR